MDVLSGAVDRIEGSLVSGWACRVNRSADRIDRVGGAVITILSDDAVIGRGETTIARPDVGGEFGNGFDGAQAVLGVADGNADMECFNFHGESLTTDGRR